MSDYPYPFVGAGEANYFEWADLHVVFTREPKPAEKKKLVADIPPPLADSADFAGKHLYVASGQGVGRIIEASYAKVPKAPTMLTTTSRFKMASKARESRFEVDTVRWLDECHAIVPIAVAYRRQDWEAGGTTLNDWHAWSVVQVPALLKLLGTPKKGAGLEYMTNGLAAEHERWKPPATKKTAAAKAKPSKSKSSKSKSSKSKPSKSKPSKSKSKSKK